MRSVSLKKQSRIPMPRILLPIGHPDRDRATVSVAKSMWQTTQCNIASWEEILNDLKAEQTWERYPPEAPYGSLDRLLEEEIGYSVNESISVVTKRTQQAIAEKEKTGRKLGKHGGDRKSEQAKNQGSDSYLDKQNRGADYLLDRMERDYPETYESVKAGEFKSVRAAAISVGIVKESEYWSAPTDVEKLAVALRKRYTPEQRQQLRELEW